MENAKACTGLGASTSPPLGIAPGPVSLPPAHLVHLNVTPPAIQPSLPSRGVPIPPGLPASSLSVPSHPPCCPPQWASSLANLLGALPHYLCSLASPHHRRVHGWVSGAP